MSMRILFATSEVAPFAKTGGLADVAASLPRALTALGHDVAIIMPRYGEGMTGDEPVEPTGLDVTVNIGGQDVTPAILRTQLPDSDIDVFLLDLPAYFDRPALYRQGGHDYPDNSKRFCLFSRAVVQAAAAIGPPPDVIHANDWHTGLVPALLATGTEVPEGLRATASVFTIHNLAYQGQFWRWDMPLTGMDWGYFDGGQMEFWGDLNLMKTGLVFSDALTTVSPTYAVEVQTSEELGCGLDGVLRDRADALTGILNGVDYGVWDPVVDEHLVRTYDADSVVLGKAACKAALQTAVGLADDADAPLIGMIGRLAEQKGIDIALPVIRRWLAEEAAQWVILGTGDPRYEEELADLVEAHPGRVAVIGAFSSPLAHQIEAGADIFLMPSRFEPCGLNQLYSLRYGTVPVVRRTGGLADTVTDADAGAITDGTATGFSFTDYTTEALDQALTRASEAYDDPVMWAALQSTGMSQDWSWDTSAGQYVKVYEAAIAARRGG